jgi:hypothetical protein
MIEMTMRLDICANDRNIEEVMDLATDDFEANPLRIRRHSGAAYSNDSGFIDRMYFNLIVPETSMLEGLRDYMTELGYRCTIFDPNEIDNTRSNRTHCL